MAAHITKGSTRGFAAALWLALLVPGCGAPVGDAPASAKAAPPPTARHPIQDQADEAEFQEAIALFQRHRWSAAYGRFVALADRGHADASRIALFMVRYGDRLYGNAWSASPEQVEAWVGSATAAPLGGDLSGGD